MQNLNRNYTQDNWEWELCRDGQKLDANSEVYERQTW